MATENARFAELFASARGALLDGKSVAQKPPSEAGGRWGLSVALRPEERAARLVDEMTRQAMAVAGDSHWPTGAVCSSHFTVRTLERYRSHIPKDDERVACYQAAMVRAAARTDAVRLRLTGLSLSPGGVMLCADPVDAAAERLADSLADELGEAGWFEADFHRDIWYATLVHFTGAPSDPAGLIDWAAARWHMDMGMSVHTSVELVHWRFNGAQTVPKVIGAARLNV